MLVDTVEPIAYRMPVASQATALSQDAMTAKIVTFINRLAEGQDLEASDLVDLLYNNGADEVDLGPLLKMRGAIQHQDGSVEYVTPDARGVLAIPRPVIADPSPRPLSPKIARFLANNISVVRTLV